ncbi:hypothetical protein PITC_047430 [Penicillium italicum]|uniref:Uncharacterized protein n=1 Tax=Penicillium italicum TaxID=40296 RepID=A0A0A2LEI7_PENIT|nr:hypothetical protein PITC_047430 [Penicillium italicum]
MTIFISRCDAYSCSSVLCGIRLTLEHSFSMAYFLLSVKSPDKQRTRIL